VVRLQLLATTVQTAFLARLQQQAVVQAVHLMCPQVLTVVQVVAVQVAPKR
jgi:hypothetical protein